MATDEKITPVEAPVIPVLPVTPEQGKDADTGVKKGGSKSPFLEITQKDLEGMLADRGGQAKRNALKDLLSDLGVESVEDLKVRNTSYNEAETKRLELEEAQKTELDKVRDQIEASVAVQAALTKELITTRITTAVQRLAPSKGITPERFPGLIKLMNVSAIKAENNEIKDDDVLAEIDATVKLHDYLVANDTASKHGSPTPEKGKDPTKPLDISVSDARIKEMKRLRGRA